MFRRSSKNLINVLLRFFRISLELLESLGALHVLLVNRLILYLRFLQFLFESLIDAEMPSSRLPVLLSKNSLPRAPWCPRQISAQAQRCSERRSPTVPLQKQMNLIHNGDNLKRHEDHTLVFDLLLDLFASLVCTLALLRRSIALHLQNGGYTQWKYEKERLSDSSCEGYTMFVHASALELQVGLRLVLGRLEDIELLLDKLDAMKLLDAVLIHVLVYLHSICESLYKCLSNSQK